MAKKTNAIPVKEIVTNYLRKQGFDGLTDCDECGCFLGDLMPCECPNYTCIPGYAVTTKDGVTIQEKKPTGGT